MMEASVTTTPESRFAPLHDEPFIKIRAGELAVGPQLRDMWAHRELLLILIWRDLKVRYKQTMLGVTWVIIQPLLATLVFTIFIGKLARVPSEGVPYPLFAYSGLLAWTFFSNAVLTSSYSLIGNSSIITKVYFSRLIIPAAVVGVRIIDFLIASVVLIFLMPFFGVGVRWSILLLPAFVAEIALLSFAVGLWFSTLNIKYRDIGTVLPVLIQLWMFTSPIIYPSSLVPARWRLLYALNPIVGITDGVRASFFGLGFNWQTLVISMVITLMLAVSSVYSFSRQTNLIDAL